MRYFVRLVQFLLAILFIVSGISKCIDPSGTALKFSEYLLYFGFDFAVDLSLGLAWVICLVEFMVGINLLIGTARIRGLLIASLLMLVFTPLTLWLALTDAIQDCGCFGDAIRLTNWQTFWKNIVIDLLLAFLWWKRHEMYRLLGRTFRAVYSYWVFGIAIWLCWLGTWSEPWIDFRPFHPGVSIRQAVGHDEASEAEATYTCIYEREGIRQEFPLEELPDESEGWEFVETIEHPAVDVPPVTTAEKSVTLDFYAKTTEGDLFTDALLSDSSYTFLLLSPSLDDASEHDLDKIEAIYEYTIDHDYGFYCLTSRDQQQVDRWCSRTGAEYPFLFTDAQIIETITRANPGLLLLHDGVICWKSRLSTLDTLPKVSAKLNEQTYGEIQYFRTREHYFWLFLLLFIPIALPLCTEIVSFIKKLLTNKDSNNA